MLIPWLSRASRNRSPSSFMTPTLWLLVAVTYSLVFTYTTYFCCDYTIKAFAHGYGRMSACQRQQLIRIANEVAVALFGQKQLAVVGEIQLLRVARDDGVEVGGAA